MLTKEWFSDSVQYVTHLRTLKCAAFTVLIALGQLPAAESTDNNQRLALMRYDILLREIHSYQVKADDLKGKGEPDSFLRSFHKDRLELTTERSGLLVQLAHRYTQDIQTVDRKALALIRAAKLKYRPSAGVEAGKVPFPPQELKDLQTERDQTTSSYIKQIEDAFGPSDFKYFDVLVRRHVEAGFKIPRGGSGGGK